MCRRWSEITRSPILWKTVNMDFSPSHGSQTTIATCFTNILPSCATRMRLDFTTRHKWTEHLNFEDLSMRLKEKCPHLELLILNHARFSDTLPSVIDMCTLSLPSVRGLIISFSQFPDSPLRGESGSFSKLELLDINFCHLRDRNKPKLSRMPHLRQLRLRGCGMANFWLEDDASFLNKLYILDLAHSLISSRTFQVIWNHGRNLKRLYLCAAHLGNEDLNFDGSVLPNLKTICLKYCHWVTDEGVIDLILSCKSLQTVYVDKTVAKLFAEHPFVTANRYMLEIVKVIGFCHSH